MADKRPRGRLTIKEVEAALRANAGVQKVAAEALHVSRSAICRFVGKHMKLQIVIREIIDENNDLAEGQLQLAIRRGEPWAIKYQLDNMGQDRGYGARKLAFKDGEGQVFVPAVLVAPPRMTPEEWDAAYGNAGKPRDVFIGPPEPEAE